MKEIALSEVKDGLSKYLRLAEKEKIVITRHGKPAGVLIGFESEDEWFDYRLEHDPRFLQRIEKARQNLRAGRGIRLEDSLNKTKIVLICHLLPSASWPKEPSKGQHPAPVQTKIESTRLGRNSEGRQFYTRTRPA